MKNLALRGAIGAAWLDALPALVGKLEAEWAITVGEAFPNGTEAFVAEATFADGQQAAVKIPIPELEKADREYRALQAADGRGYVKLLRHDAVSGATLLERLGPQLAQTGLALEQQFEIICATLQRAWMPLPAGLRLMTGAEKAASMADYIRAVWPRLSKRPSEQTRDQALRFAAARCDAFDPSKAVFGHGDAHMWNTLLDLKTGDYKFVDPDGLFIERAHDLSILMREWPGDFLAGDPVKRGRERCLLLSGLTGVDANAIWQWGFMEQFVNGLTQLEAGWDGATDFIAVAEAWTGTESV